jgi:hypothetical protein
VLERDNKFLNQMCRHAELAYLISMAEISDSDCLFETAGHSGKVLP